MGATKVPKCKQCEHYSYYRGMVTSHVCKMTGKAMATQETKTSPKWCPLRDKKEKPTAD